MARTSPMNIILCYRQGLQGRAEEVEGEVWYVAVAWLQVPRRRAAATAELTSPFKQPSRLAEWLVPVHWTLYSVVAKGRRDALEKSRARSGMWL
jgi:hypothetical protein